jgi:hypothetical protein
MSMARRKTVAACAAVLVLGCGCSLWQGVAALWMPSIEAHAGDGKFRNISQRAGPLAIPGYMIEFPEFNLGKPHKALYQFSSLPALGLGFGSRPCGMYLVIPENRDDWGLNLVQVGGIASVATELRDSRGEVVAQTQGKLRDMIWGNWHGANRLYQLRSSFFDPVNSESYTLQVDYSPDPGLAPYEARVGLECGGRL